MSGRTATAKIRRRILTGPAQGRHRCIAWGCTALTQQSAGSGLSALYCASHTERLRRHGHSTRKTYSYEELRPYRAAAKRWLKRNETDGTVRRVIAALDSMLESAGLPPDVAALRWMDQKTRARAVLARVRERGRDGRKILEVILTVRAAYHELGPRGNPEFLDCQFGKAIHRLGSGYHRTFGEGDGKWQYSQYPRAEGQFLRELGRSLFDVAGIVVTGDVIEDLLTLKPTPRSQHRVTANK